MPGITGVVQSGINPKPETHYVQDMIQALLHYPWYQWTQKNLSGAALGSVSLGTLARMPQCVVSEDGRYALAFEGELYNDQELCAELNRQRENLKAGQASLVLHAMRRWGAGALKRLNGLFQIAFWDAQKQELIVSCDPAGLRPLYYTHQGNKIAFAPEVKALLVLPWVSREIDFAGVMSFLRHGLPLGERTFFEAVKVLPAGCFARFRRGRVEIQRYFQMRFAETSPLTENEMQSRFVETWREVIRRQSENGDRMGVLLNGGLDSRLILAGLVSQDKHFPTFTTGRPDCKDSYLAKQAAEASGCPNLFSPIVANEAACGLERAVYMTDGMFNCFHANVRHLLPSLVETVDLVYDDISPFDNIYNARERPRRRQNDPAQWLHEAVSGVDLRALRSGREESINLLSEAGDLVEEAFLARDQVNDFTTAAQSHSAGSTSLPELFRFEEHRHRLFGCGPFLLRTVVEVRCPYFDKQMLELIPLMSPRHRSADKPLHKHAIQRLAPQLAQIPWGRTGLPLTAGTLKTSLHLGVKFMRRKTRSWLASNSEKVARAMCGEKAIDYDHLMRSSSELQRVVWSRLVSQWPEGSRLFDRKSVQTLLAHHFTGQGNDAELIGRILTVETWYQLFVRQSTRTRTRNLYLAEAA